MGLGLHESTGYATTIVGAAFRVEIGFKRVRIWLPMEGKRKSVKSSDIVSVSALPNGYTKISVRMVGDIIVPTSATESVLLQKSLNALLSEIHSTRFRRMQAIYPLPSLGGKEGRKALLGLAIGVGLVWVGLYLGYSCNVLSESCTRARGGGFLLVILGLVVVVSVVSLALRGFKSERPPPGPPGYGGESGGGEGLSGPVYSKPLGFHRRLLTLLD